MPANILNSEPVRSDIQRRTDALEILELHSKYDLSGGSKFMDPNFRSVMIGLLALIIVFLCVNMAGHFLQ